MMMLLLLTAWGADPEADRIAESLGQSVKEGEWRAVERRYLELLKAHPSGLSGPIHQTGAQAAKNRGDLLLATQRLMRVRDDELGYAAAKGDLDILGGQTGLVMLSTDPPAPLQAAAMPFIPDLRLSIESASAKLEKDGWFVGLLPVGQYTLGSNTFEVPAGRDWIVVHASP